MQQTEAIHIPDAAERAYKLVCERRELVEQSPMLLWTPHKDGQDQFLRAKHPARIMVPGNGFGKTSIAGREVDYWAHGNHPYQQATMPRASKVLIYWFCEQFKQFDALREQLEDECLSKIYSWNEQDHAYTFSSGARMVISSYDRPWTDIQGIPVDLFIFDEEPPLKLWREARRRRRGKRKTRLVIAATATQGDSWMEREIWKPWADAHKAAGVSIDDAREQQIHPFFWVWDKGGIYNNPGMDAQDIAEYESQTWSSDEEKRVRQHGGFGNFSGRPVFDLPALNVLEEQMGVWDKTRGPGKSMGLAVMKDGKATSALDSTPDQLKGRKFVLDEGAIDKGRLEIWEMPVLGGTYVIGGDCAKGMEGGDYDSADIFIKPGARDPLGTKPRQVGKLLGKWGERFDRLLYAAAYVYNGAFILLERQEGLAIMRRLWDEYKYTYIYYQRNPAQPNRAVMDALGHARVHDDFTIRKLQIALRNQEVELRSRDTLEQMRKVIWHKPGEDPGISERPSDRELKLKLRGGGSPDQTMSLAYAWLALDEVFHYDKPADLFPPDSLGDIFDYAKVFAKPQGESPVSPDGTAFYGGRKPH